MSDDTRTEEPDVPELPAIPEYNAKLVRRASRRGVVRVAVTAALLIGLVFAAIDFGSGAVARSHHPRNAAIKALGALYLAHPGYEPTSLQPGQRGLNQTGVSRTGDFNSVMYLQQTDPLANGVGAPSALHVHQSVFGDAEATDFIAPTKLETAIRKERPTKDATRRVLRGLPSSSASSVAMELATPMNQDEFNAFSRRLGLATWVTAPNGNPDAPMVDTSIFTPMHAMMTLDQIGGSGGPQTVIDSTAPLVAVPPGFQFDTGSARTGSAQMDQSSATQQLRQFAAGLKPSDNSLLIDVGQKPANEVQAIAEAGKIYGFTMSGLSPTEIATYLDRPEIRSVAVADAVLNTAG